MSAIRLILTTLVTLCLTATPVAFADTADQSTTAPATSASAAPATATAPAVTASTISAPAVTSDDSAANTANQTNNAVGQANTNNSVSSSTHATAKKLQIVNINTADASTIASSLHGIGNKRAEAIVTYRNQNGPFKTADDLTKIKGISKKIVEENRSHIVLS